MGDQSLRERLGRRARADMLRGTTPPHADGRWGRRSLRDDGERSPDPRPAAPRVVMVLPAYLPESYGGAEQQTRRLARRWPAAAPR